jgi:transcriptional regulator with XRE-family HTH domain
LPFCHVTLRGQKPHPRAYPRALCTIGDHLRRRRLDLGLLQRQVAERLGADHSSVTNWERNRTKPALHFLPGIVCFLGYVPWAAGASVGERLLALRRQRGVSQAMLARLLGIDPGTLSRWERGLRVPAGRYVRLLEAFLERLAAAPPRARDL